VSTITRKGWCSPILWVDTKNPFYSKFYFLTTISFSKAYNSNNLAQLKQQARSVNGHIGMKQVKGQTKLVSNINDQHDYTFDEFRICSPCLPWTLGVHHPFQQAVQVWVHLLKWMANITTNICIQIRLGDHKVMIILKNRETFPSFFRKILGLISHNMSMQSQMGPPVEMMGRGMPSHSMIPCNSNVNPYSLTPSQTNSASSMNPLPPISAPPGPLPSMVS